jgi:hypothetical protein
LSNREICRPGGAKERKAAIAAEAAGFEVMVTVDQSIPHQQNVGIRKIAILILPAPTNRPQDLKQTIPAALAVLTMVQPGEAVTVVFESL